MQMLLATNLCRMFGLQIEELLQEHSGRNGTSSRRISTILNGLEPENVQHIKLIVSTENRQTISTSKHCGLLQHSREPYDAP